MTIASTQTKTIYGGNGSTAAFAVPFMFMHDDDIEVVLRDANDLEFQQFSGTHYTLAGAGSPSGGICTMNTPPEVKQTLLIRRNPAMVQEVDYVENDAFPAATHEAALDKLTMICQALSERLDRTISFRVSSAVSGVTVPDPEPNLALAWSESDNRLVNRDVADMGGVLLPLAVSQGGTGGTTASEALTSLGFGLTGKAVAASKTEQAACAAIDAEPADTAILKADLPDLLQAVYGDEAQVHTGTDLSTLTVERNHILWTLTADSAFSEASLPYDGTYVFHVYPAGHALAIGATYKTDGNIALPKAGAGEIRIAVEQYNGRKSIVGLQNMEA